MPSAVILDRASLQLIHFVRERHVVWKAERYIFIEMNHEHLIFGIAGAGKRQGRGNHFTALRSHGSAVVDDQAYRDRDIFVAETFNLLGNSVLVNLKVFFGEFRNRSTFAVAHGRV